MKEIRHPNVSDDDHSRYHTIVHAIKQLRDPETGKKFTAEKVIPPFLVDALEIDQRRGFKKLRELWKKATGSQTCQEKL